MKRTHAPASEDLETRDKTTTTGGGGGKRARTPEENAELAGRLTAEVFDLTEDDGSPDYNVSLMIGHAIRGTTYSERTLFANAFAAKEKAKKKPPQLFFLDMLTWGLKEIPDGPDAPPASVAGSPARRPIQPDTTPPVVAVTADQIEKYRAKPLMEKAKR